jgi:hypothetical protein
MNLDMGLRVNLVHNIILQRQPNPSILDNCLRSIIRKTFAGERQRPGLARLP